MTSIPLEDVQGNILRGYGFDHAVHLLLHTASTEAARRCLTRVVDDVADAVLWTWESRPGTALNVGVTATGLERLGVPGHVLADLPEAFREGPRVRAEMLGDTGASDPDTWEDGLGTGRVHLVLSLYARDPDDLGTERARLERLVADDDGLSVVATHEAQMLACSREHFGYADGLAQPDVEGVDAGPRRAAVARGGGVPLPDGSWRPVRLGEFLLGHVDEDGETNLDASEPLLRNGSYLVYRKLAQRVGAFRRALSDAAALTGLDPELVAAKVVGRWRDGTAVELEPARGLGEDLSAAQVDQPSNDFRFAPGDADGHRCPVGSHIRRANPRDGLDFGGTVRESGRLTARHRIIRRGMPYGPPLPPGAEEDGQDRGLLFVCFNADIARQFETIQAVWCNDGDAFGLGDDRDFLFGDTGGSGKITIPVAGSRPRFADSPREVVVTRGAEYLLAPGLSALRLLAAGGVS